MGYFFGRLIMWTLGMLGWIVIYTILMTLYVVIF